MCVRGGRRACSGSTCGKSKVELASLCGKGSCEHNNKSRAQHDLSVFLPYVTTNLYVLGSVSVGRRVWCLTLDFTAGRSATASATDRASDTLGILMNP